MEQKFDITVLYVEDENIFRTVLKEILEEVVLRVVLANDGLSGLDAYEANRPDIVITDIAMPKLNGLEMLRAIKKKNPELCTIVTTSYSETEYFLEAIELGVNRFVLKPFDRGQFKEILLELIRSISYGKELKAEELRRKNAEEALKNSELLFRTLISDAPQAIFLADPFTGKIIDANESAVRLLGYSHEELLRRYQSDLIGPEKALECQSRYNELLNNNVLQSQGNEITFFKKDNGVIIAEVNERIIKFSDYTLVMGIITDLTERKKTEQNLVEYHSHLEQLVEQRTIELTTANLRLKKELEASEVAEKMRQRKSAIERLMLMISTDFITTSPASILEQINSSLQKICELTNAGKAFVWLLDEDGTVKTNYHYLSEGLDFRLLAHKGFVINKLPLIWKEISEGNFWAINNSDLLPKLSQEYRYLSENKVSSALFYPLSSEHGITGVIGLMAFDELIVFDADTHFLLNMASKMLANAFLRHEAAIALINSEEKAHALLNASTASMLLFDVEGTLLEVNESAAEAMEMPNNLLIGKNYFELFPPSISEKRWPVVQQVIETGEKITFRDSYKNMSFEHLIYPVKNQDAKVDRVAMMTREITSYIDAQNQIRNQYSFLQTLINSLPNPIYYKDAIGHFLGINKDFLTITGKSRQEIIGQKYVFDNTSDLDSALNRHNDELNEANPVIRFEETVPYSDGINHTVLIYQSLYYDVGGQIGGMIGVMVDINEVKRFEHELKELNFNLETRVVEELKRTEKQQSKLIQKSKIESLGQLAAGMAHEINQPLGGISMSLENIILKQSRGNLSEHYLVSKIDQCYENISRIKQIIDHIRTFSRDQQNTNIEKVDARDAISNTLLLVEALYRNYQIKLEISMPQKPLFFFGNKYKLEQVILNLLSNAKDAVLEKEKVFDSQDFQKRVTINCKSVGASLYLIVNDNGIGIEKEKLDLLFEPFYTTKETNKGTGLGLSIVYGIIREFDGNISIESTYGEGTIVEIMLPLAADELD